MDQDSVFGKSSHVLKKVAPLAVLLTLMVLAGCADHSDSADVKAPPQPLPQPPKPAPPPAPNSTETPSPATLPIDLSACMVELSANVRSTRQTRDRSESYSVWIRIEIGGNYQIEVNGKTCSNRSSPMLCGATRYYVAALWTPVGSNILLLRGRGQSEGLASLIREASGSGDLVMVQVLDPELKAIGLPAIFFAQTSKCKSQAHGHSLP